MTATATDPGVVVPMPAATAARDQADRPVGAIGHGPRPGDQAIEHQGSFAAQGTSEPSRREPAGSIRASIVRCACS